MNQPKIKNIDRNQIRKESDKFMRIKINLMKADHIPSLLKLSCFLIIFALTSSIVSVWFDHARRDIDVQLINSKNEQKLFRSVYERLWEEYFKLKSSKYSISEYAQSVSAHQSEKDATQLICMFDHLKAFYSEQTIIYTLNKGKQYLTKRQVDDYGINEIEKKTNLRIAEIEDAYDDHCALIVNYEVGQGTAATTSRIELIIQLSRELKAILEKRVLSETALLTQNYKTSNLAIFTAFLLQIFVFSVISVVDIRTASFRRNSQ